MAGKVSGRLGGLGARGIHSLQSYGQDNPVYDNNAYTITSIYNDGTLKMYTSHPTQPTSPESRPEYYMTQINTWGMTGNLQTFRQGATAFRNARDWTKEQRDEAIKRANERATSPESHPEYYMTQLRSFAMTDTAETFRQGATAFRNARDWAKEQRDEAIKRANEIANERANDSQAEAPAVDSSFGLASSFASEASLDEPYTIEPLSQETRTSLNEDSNTTANHQESETSTDELGLDYRLPAKRSSRDSKRSHQSQRKRRNAGESSST